MICSKCGFENKEGSKFCLKCGNRLVAEAQSGISLDKGNIPAETNTHAESPHITENIPDKTEQTASAVVEPPSNNNRKNLVIALSSVAAVVIIAAAAIVTNKNNSPAVLNDITAETLDTVDTLDTGVQTTLTEDVATFTTRQTTVATTTTTDSDFSTENSTYREIYNSFLDYLDTDNNDYQYFELYDLDSDGIPELFMSEGKGHMSQVDIFAIDSNSEIIVLGEDLGAYGYVTMKGRYIASWEWMEKSGDRLVECSADLQQKLENDTNYCDDIGYKYALDYNNFEIAFDEFDADPTHGGDVYKYDYLSDTSASMTDNSSTYFVMHNDPSVNDELYYQYERLADISYRDYSLYDIFTDVEAVARIVASYSNGELSFDDFYYNCYSYSWHFGDDYGQAENFSFCVYVPGYHEPSYRIYVPLEPIVPYLKESFSHNLLPETYSFCPGNTEGNYANFSGCVTQTDCGIPYGVIYCGGNDYSDWRVRSNVWDYYDKIVVNDLSDMVLYEDGGSDYAYIYYRNSGDDCALYRVSINGTERIKLTDTRASNVRMYDDYIYYSSDKKFWRMNRDGSGKTKIIDAYCYLPSFYNDMIYCISSDDSCLDIYDINGGSALDHMYLDSRPMHIDNFFIKQGILIARGYYTDNEEHFVTIRSLENPSIEIQYSINCGGINADDDYIYICYDDNGTVRMAKTPLHEFTNTEATWNYDISDEFINSYFNLVEYDADKYYIFQADYEGIWHRFDLY